MGCQLLPDGCGPSLFSLSHHTFACPLLAPPPPGRWSSDGVPAAPFCAHVAGSATRFHSHTGRPSKVHHPHLPPHTHTHTHTHPFFSFCWRLSVGVSTAPGLLRAFTLFFLSHHTHSPAPFWPPPSPGRWSSDGLPAAPSCAHVAGSATRFHSHTGRPSKVHHPHLPPHTHTHPFFSSCWRLSVGVSTAPGLPPAFFFIFTASPSPTITFSSHPVVNGDCPWPSHPHIQRGRRPSAPGSLRTNSIAFLFGSFSGVLGSKRLHAPSLHACKLPDVTRP